MVSPGFIRFSFSSRSSKRYLVYSLFSHLEETRVLDFFDRFGLSVANEIDKRLFAHRSALSDPTKSTPNPVYTSLLVEELVNKWG